MSIKKPFQPTVTSPLSSLMKEQSFSTLLVQARQAGQIEQVIAQWPQLRGISFQIGPLKGSVLKLFLGTPAALTRIRQQLPSLVNYLQSKGWSVTEIRLQIQTQQSQSKILSNRPKQAVFTPSAKKAWLDLEDRLDNPILLEATRALYRHHKLK